MTRITWPELPEHIRDLVEGELGSTVVAAVSQPGGYSPGTADRVVCADGTRAFVKAVSPAQNDQSPELYRTEARILERFPRDAPVPALRAWYDVDEWVCLVIDDVEGQHPQLPWRAEELDCVLAALDELGRTVTPSPLDGLPDAASELATMYRAWARWDAEGPPSDLDPWLARRLPELAARAARGLAALTGDTLTHFDLRADNMLIGTDGRVWFVDWPWAMNAAAWADPTFLVIEVATSWADDPSGPQPDDVLRRIAATHGVDTEPLVDNLIGITAYFQEIGRLPDPPGLPTLRAFQRRQGAALADWLRRSELG